MAFSSYSLDIKVFAANAAETNKATKISLFIVGWFRRIPFDFKIYINLGFIPSIINKLFKDGDPPQERTAQERHNLEHRKEMHRRKEARDRIASLPLRDRGQAQVSENKRIKGYIQSHAICRYCHPP